MIGGTIVFALFGGVSFGATYMLVRTKRFTQDEGQICCVSNAVAWFCMWLMWICTWLHQWHPIIVPQHMAAEGHTEDPDDGGGSAPSGGGGGGH